MELYLFPSTELLEIWFPKLGAHLCLVVFYGKLPKDRFKLSDTSIPPTNSFWCVLRTKFRIAFIIMFTSGKFETDWISDHFKELLKLHTEIFTDRMIWCLRFALVNGLGEWMEERRPVDNCWSCVMGSWTSFRLVSPLYMLVKFFNKKIKVFNNMGK